MKSCSLNVLLVLASLAVALALSEFFLGKYEVHLLQSAGIFVPADPSIDGAAWDVDPGNPERFKFGEDGNSLVHVRSDNRKLVYEIRPSTVISDMIRTNSHGFRDEEFHGEKPAGTYRVCVVGDSITFGWLQKPEETYPKVLERLLNSRAGDSRIYEVYNMGVGGYNAAQELELIRTKVLPLNPDLIVIGYCTNDNMVGFDAGLWRHFTRSRSRTWDFLTLKCRQFRENRNEKSLVERSYEGIARLSQESGVPVTVAIFPDGNELEGENCRRQEELCTRLGIGTVNLFGPFDKAGRDLTLADIVHPTTLGHEVAAKALYEYLDDNVLSKSKSNVEAGGEAAGI